MIYGWGVMSGCVVMIETVFVVALEVLLVVVVCFCVLVKVGEVGDGG